jgi:formylmethanofuran dehydrogenase subunit A
MVTFQMSIKESVEGSEVVYEAFTPQLQVTKGTQEFQDAPFLRNIELWITGNVWEVKMAMA